MKHFSHEPTNEHFHSTCKKLINRQDHIFWVIPLSNSIKTRQLVALFNVIIISYKNAKKIKNEMASNLSNRAESSLKH